LHWCTRRARWAARRSAISARQSPAGYCTAAVPRAVRGERSRRRALGPNGEPMLTLTISPIDTMRAAAAAICQWSAIRGDFTTEIFVR